jgi:D-lactate dehydrogenase (cytochrome)
VAYRGGSPFTFLIDNQASAVTGLRVVLPTGELVTTGAKAYEKADSHFNRYSWCNDLTGLFLGAEGTAGVITEIGLKVEEQPEAMGHMTYGFPDYASAVKALWGTRKAQIPAGFVFLSDGRTMDLIEPDGAPHNLEALVKWARIVGRKPVVEEALETGHKICDEAGGKNLGEGMAKELWEDRYYNAAAYLYAFGSRITFHAVVPLGRAAPFLELGRKLQDEMKEKYDQPMSVSGHPMDRAFLILLSFGVDVQSDEWPDKSLKKFNHMKNTMLDAGAVVYRGAIEYGSDQLYRTGEYYELMKKLKKCIDPKGIMAPGYAGLNFYKP